MSLWRDWPWSVKLGLLLAVLAVVPLSIVTLITGAATRDELLEATRQQNLQRARSTAGTLDHYLERVLSDIRIVAMAPPTVRFLAAPEAGTADPVAREDARLSLQQMRDTHGFEAIYLLDSDGEVALATDERLVGRSYFSSPPFLQGKAGNAVVHEPRWDPKEEEPFLHVSAPVRHAGGPIQGVAVGRLPLSDLDEILSGDTNFAGRGAFGVLWDDRGIRLSFPTRPELRFQPFEPLPADVVERMELEQRFGPDTAARLRVERPVPNLVKRSKELFYDPKSEPFLRVEIDGEPVHAALVPLRQQRWVYGVFSGESDALAAVRVQTRRILLIALLTAGLAIALGLLAARWATHPLRRLGQTANAIAAGDMYRRVGLRQRDEIGQMAAAFDAMADALAAKEAELRGYADQLEQRVAEQTSELRELVAREQEARRRAEEANRVKDEFLSTVSHELRTPLNAILGWGSLLASGRLDETAARRAMEAIERNARSQSQIIDDLLDVSRIITGKLRLKVKPVRLALLVESAIDSVRPAAGAKEIRIDTRLDTEVTAPGDPDRLQQVVWNLLSNAVKFTPTGGRVEVSVTEEEGEARIRVADTGIGIPREFLGFVFDRFRQADSSTTRTYGGLGLGLSIVRHLVELHGGSVSVDSEGEGRGATFTVGLPLAAAGFAAEPEPRPVVRVEGGDGNLAGLRVLVVDDEPDARDVTSAALEQHGAEVTAVPSAAAALDALGRAAFDVLVADIGMPQEDGYSLIGKVRELHGALRDLPAIALTAYAADGDRHRALEAGFQLHLAKPIDSLGLASAVAAVAR